MSNDLKSILKRLLRNPVLFSHKAGGIKLRSYQEKPVKAIIRSVMKGSGHSFVVMFSRQSGKNEIQAQIEAYLLTRLSQLDCEMVKVSPTWKPQCINAMRRLERRLDNNLLTARRYEKEEGYIYRIGKAQISFFSGQPEAHIVGATASTLLEVDEAQDVSISKFDKDIAPMGASTNVTRVFYGTAWTSSTLLARELREARRKQRRDKIRRVFIVNGDMVGRELPAYKKFLTEQVEKLGINHPLVQSQFYCKEIDSAGKLFTTTRIQLIQSEDNPPLKSNPNYIYAFLIDVAGEEESSNDPEKMEQLVFTGHDFTSLIIVHVDLSAMNDPTINRPIYRAIHAVTWDGAKQHLLFNQIRALYEIWKPQQIVVDATGVGAGLASFLEEALPGRVIPFIFTPQSKSKMGWEFIGMIDTGRFKFSTKLKEWKILNLQMTNCTYEIVPGPSKLLRWSVPDDLRDPLTGNLVHDDILISCALSSVLDDCSWGAPGQIIVPAPDPLLDYDRSVY